ncbi:hypothetical protein [Haladaptatus halobius]|uniref:hypothetical protein n=1 Tax=Haladaptatus halobius TaxID=2884875 RepID=UPI001D0A3626|nr:hypothetical protein [Haladaptatus halobius]
MVGEQLITCLIDMMATFSESHSIAIVGLFGLFLAGFLGASGLKHMRGSQQRSAPGPDEIDYWFDKRED